MPLPPAAEPDRAGAGGSVETSRVIRWLRRAGLVAAGAVLVWTLFSSGADLRAQQGQPPARTGGWTVPEGAADEKNPLPSGTQTIVAGRALFQKNCQRCHGPKGVGDGPDADPDHMADMDLTNPSRAARNPDGVVFYKVWNGRQKPKMPAFKDELTREQVWAIVAYVQSLRKQPAS